MSCYRDRDNLVYYARNEHRHDCADPACRGCVACPEDHCTAARSCSLHVAEGHITCPRCMGRVRNDLRKIGENSALALSAAIEDGTDSEAAYLAGPATDPRDRQARRLAMFRHLDTFLRLRRISDEQWEHAMTAMEDDDNLHPYALLTRWWLMLAEDYGHPLPERLSIVGAVDYLDRQLGRIAQDPEQDFALLASEVKACREHLDLVLSILPRQQRGVECLACVEEGVAKPPRLRLERAHWCDDPECHREHWPRAEDMWTCPKDRTHKWTDEQYRTRVADVYAEQSVC